MLNILNVFFFFEQPIDHGKSVFFEGSNKVLISKKYYIVSFLKQVF